MDGRDALLPTVADGTRFLCLGPPLSGKREFALQLLSDAAAAGRWGVLVTTDVPAAHLTAEHPAAFGERTVIVDCTGTPTDPDGVTLFSVASAADLTGIAIAISKAFSIAEADGTDRPVVVLDSLTTLSLYSDFDRLYRFVHTVAQQITERDGVLAATIDDDAIESRDIATLSSVIDARVEFRNQLEYRIVGLDTGPSEWTAFDPGRQVEPAADVDTSPATTGAATGAEGERSAAGEDGQSLASFIARVTSSGPTLTLCNVDERSDVVDVVTDHFRRLNVTVETATLSVDEPSGVALLHRDADLIAASPVSAVAASIDGRTDGDDSARTSETPDVLTAVTHDVFGADGVDRSVLLRASRTVERLALAGGSGTLYAAFQKLSRLRDDPQTLRIYEELAAMDVDVHVFGEEDVPRDELPEFTFHGHPHEELVDAWFVVYDGGQSASRAGALVTHETTPNVYDGFWTYQPDLTERAVTVVRERTGLDE